MSQTIQDTIPNLWPADIRVDTLSPVAILRTQAGNLSRMTGGLLQGFVATLDAVNGEVQIVLDMVAPALGNYRHRILVATHNARFAYPVKVEATCFEPPDDADDHWDWPRASTQDEFLSLVRQVLKSPEIRSVIESLVARSNEEAAANSPTGSQP